MAVCRAALGVGRCHACLQDHSFQSFSSCAALRLQFVLLALKKLTDPAVVLQVAHLKRGIYGWNMAGLPFVGDYNDADIGRTPSVVCAVRLTVRS